MFHAARPTHDCFDAANTLQLLYGVHQRRRRAETLRAQRRQSIEQDLQALLLQKFFDPFFVGACDPLFQAMKV